MRLIANVYPKTEKPRSFLNVAFICAGPALLTLTLANIPKPRDTSQISIAASGFQKTISNSASAEAPAPETHTRHSPEPRTPPANQSDPPDTPSCHAHAPEYCKYRLRPRNAPTSPAPSRAARPPAR